MMLHCGGALTSRCLAVKMVISFCNETFSVLASDSIFSNVSCFIRSFSRSARSFSKSLWCNISCSFTWEVWSSEAFWSCCRRFLLSSSSPLFSSSNVLILVWAPPWTVSNWAKEVMLLTNYKCVPRMDHTISIRTGKCMAYFLCWSHYTYTCPTLPNIKIFSRIHTYPTHPPSPDLNISTVNNVILSEFFYVNFNVLLNFS